MNKKTDELKDSRISVRITGTLRSKVQEKLQQDGITMSDFLTACMMDYVGIVPDTKEAVKKLK